jgi:hypothetical protein
MRGRVARQGDEGDLLAAGVLEGAGQELALQIDGKKPRAGINVLVAGHAGLPKPDTPSSLDVQFGSRQDALHEKRGLF